VNSSQWCSGIDESFVFADRISAEDLGRGDITIQAQPLLNAMRARSLPSLKKMIVAGPEAV